MQEACLLCLTGIGDCAKRLSCWFDPRKLLLSQNAGSQPAVDKLIKRPEYTGKTIVVLLPDTAERDLGTYDL